VHLKTGLLLSALLLAPILSGGLEAQEETVLFLVRHAERADDGGQDPAMATDPHMAEDPHLSEAGRSRALLLAGMLRDARLTHIHSTDFRRTRETAQPTAQASGLDISLYDSSDPEGFAARLRSTPGRHLIVGHSNSTPNLIRALGGDPGPPIESLEYDRLYILTLLPEGTRTVLLRFGEH
jgi:probable phosphoglycerate mutase